MKMEQKFINAMKYFMATMSFVFAITSCTSGEDEPVPVQSSELEEKYTPEYSSLINNLNDYSTDFSISHPTSKSRSGWKRFWRSVKADYCGYTDADNIRHEALSISTSRKYWKAETLREDIEKIERELSTAEKKAIQNQVDDLVLIYSNDSTNFGALHNAAILTILLEDEMDFNNTEELASSTLKSLKKLGLDTTGVTAKTVANDIDMFFEDIYSDDTDIMFNRLSIKYPERKAELRILENYITIVEDFDSIEDIQNFTDGYISIINKSQIKPCDKEKLSSNISIAPASRQLWEEIDALSLQ